MTAIAVVFAGGVGRRAAIGDLPKQFLTVAGRPIIGHTLAVFEDHPQIEAIYIACVADWIDWLNSYVDEARLIKVRGIVPGGELAQQSIRNALQAAADHWSDDTIVLVHDAVRPIIDGALLSAVISHAEHHGNAVSCVPAAETIVLSEDGESAVELLPRSRSYIAQAPQAFELGSLRAAHQRYGELDPRYDDVVDSATLMARCGHRIHLVAGSHGNLKVTYPVDVGFLWGYFAEEES
ncbi:MAG: 2-C-methyl-D-erythritol 4-phosphate cytidylyltransferase [Propionicimonas sp.]